MPAETSDQSEKNIETGQQGTHEPWKKPGQSSQDPSQDAPHPRPRRDSDNSTS